MATTIKNVYIPSLEANEIYSHMHRDKELALDHCGMIPFSLELMKLNKLKDFSIFTVKTSEKNFSNDIINVKFKQSVKSGEFLIKQLSKKIADENTNDNYRQKLIEFKSVLENEKHLEKWQGLSNDKLREQLYLNGFTLTDNRGKQTKYVVYKRSSSKSRTGQCLFVKESLHEEMINWSRMYLPFKEDMEIDYASLLAYESLVLSSIEDTIEINPKHILIVKDIESKFDQTCNVVRKDNEKDCLDSFNEKVEVVNSLFDGESLLDSKYFAKGQSMKLLRNHMFKSAAFNCNIQKFLREKCPKSIPFDEWKIESMFEKEKILAKDVELIITPSSLKALKFSRVLGGEKEMWNYWKGLIAKEGTVNGAVFGVCKSEKKSKRGIDQEGNILQQTSYQMLNSMPMTKDDIANLVTFEKEYIEKLKNNDDFFIQYIIDNANELNSNLMFVDLYKRNKGIVNTKVFRDFRKSEINKYVTHVKKGKARLTGDYCVMLGNPMEFLYHAIGKFDVKKSELALKHNEIYTTLFDFDKELVGFRNPHTSPSNVLKAKNTYNEDICSYFNLSDNIVCVNAVGFAIQDILSGCDYDSDSLVLFDNEFLHSAADKCFGKYFVCINKVESQKKQYNLNDMDMCKIDNQLAESQDYIGTVVNLGQLCMSRYWDLKEKGNANHKILDSLMRKTDIMTVLSGIAIDMAKKFYELDIEKEIKNVEKDLIVKNKWTKDKKGEEKPIPAKPLFFKYVSQNKNIKNKVVNYNCPMDYLHNEMSDLPYAEHHEDVEFTSLLVKHDKRKGNRKQKRKILDYVDNMNIKINKMFDKYEDGKERNNAIGDVIKYYDFYMQKLEVKPDTMFSILDDMKVGKLPVKLLNVLYQTQKQAFLEAFKQG